VTIQVAGTCALRLIMKALRMVMTMDRYSRPSTFSVLDSPNGRPSSRLVDLVTVTFVTR
jgi:hypothetical protein